MSRTSIDITGIATGEGEVESLTFDGHGLTGRLVITGGFSPGDSLELREGRRVAVFTEDAVREWGEAPPHCPSCDALSENLRDKAAEIGVVRHDNTVLERKLRDREAQILDVEGQLVDAREQLDGILKYQT